MRQLRIAIAEDDWLVAEHLRTALAALGHRAVGCARTGEELVELVARKHPDLALVDVGLAGDSDGLVAAKEIQQRFAVPAIAVTGHLTVADGSWEL